MPTIAGTVSVQYTDLTGWSGGTHITAGGILRYNVDSCTDIERCLVAMKVVKK